jgi:hypothetical protein
MFLKVYLYGNNDIEMYSSNNGVCNNGMDVGNNGFVNSSNMPLNTWYHLSTVFSGSTGRIFVNGAQTAIKYNMQGSRNITRSNTKIGSSGSRVAIDEIKMYNRALTDAEIHADFKINGPLF